MRWAFWRGTGRMLYSLSLRRSTINVENVGVRLRQSSAICLRAFARSAFFYLLDRHALLAMTMGSKWIITHSLTTPGCAHPSNGGEPGTYRRGIKFPSAEGCRLCRRGGHCTPPPVAQSAPPPARTTHANYVCAGPGRRWAL